MKDEILEQIDKLKMMVMLDDKPKETESDKFDKWLDRLHGRVTPDEYPWKFPSISNEKWARYSLLRSFVTDLYDDKYKKSKEYQKGKPEIQRMIANVILMTMFYEEQL